MSSERKSPVMLMSQDETRTMIGDFTKVTVSNSNDDLHLVQATCARLDGRMPDIPEVEIWRTLSLSMFLLSHLCTSLVLWILAQYNGIGTGFYHRRRYVKWRGVSPYAGSAKWLP